MALPTFLVIGAMKCGTSSLYRYLALHPRIGMSRIKETNFFLLEGNYGRGLAWYESLFPKDAQVRGEASPNYSKRQLHPGVPERIAAVLPDAKLVFLARDPVERIVSHYVHNVSKGRESRPLEEAVALQPGYLNASRYADQLEPFVETFGRQNVLVLCSEEFRRRRRETLAEVFAFLGADPAFDSPDFVIEHHSSAEKARRARLRQLVPHRWLRERIPDWWPIPGAERPRFGTDAADRVRDLLRDDVARFRALTGMEFAPWSL